MKSRYWLALASVMSVSVAQAADKDVTMNMVSAEGIGQSAGTISISETEHGLLFTPDLKSFPASGIHGFHVHAQASCEPATENGEKVAAKAAGGHFDPEDTGSHEGPYSDGHLGDLPALYVKDDGTAMTPVLAPRLMKVSEIEGRALMIHAGGDNYSDQPEALGGGGKRVACGVIEG
ncbi:MAG TPA: superoxide dismutase [Cu-Zn] SodC2 [Pseudomonas xinjiangensis]|uniref:Superoxide dismutase [Cu-Zn] n=2 Tax=root TaxID=1 RepID=A0A7V1BPM5_9GAMM|nr:superoxide dismutase [Cu-Zn] SodC2 [Halopseudomonas xinjiangensis]HEC48366.1 superoxide dismutase [Cu-Zn] SodC2 [Halopseudomonas xinjiangensis]